MLDNRYYGGSCLPTYIQDVRFRKPHNLQQYTLQVTLSMDLKTRSFILLFLCLYGSIVGDQLSLLKSPSSKFIHNL